jgi:signal transduction histidine kinase
LPHLRLLPGYKNGIFSFLPLGSVERPVGVLALALPQAEKYDRARCDTLRSLSNAISGSILRARSYDDVLAARVSAETAVKTRDEFLCALSHELKNPMTPILGWSVALSSGTLSAERQNFALDVILRNVRALNYLIEDMFDAVRISSGKLRLQCSEIRVQDIAREALTVIQRTVEDKKLSVLTEISEAVPAFVADPHRLRQVLLNLLNNAVKFTPAGGTISLKIVRHDNSVECTISDTGMGIEPRFLPQVFDRFRQENRSRKGKVAGLGLGLAIVREIVTLHGGMITASSKGPDKGASFVLRLPLRRSHNHKTQPATSAKHRKRILRTPKKRRYLLRSSPDTRAAA